MIRYLLPMVALLALCGCGTPPILDSSYRSGTFVVIKGCNLSNAPAGTVLRMTNSGTTRGPEPTCEITLPDGIRVRSIDGSYTAQTNAHVLRVPFTETVTVGWEKSS